MSFTHLHVHSNFSFLDGGSSVQALLDRAKQIGCDSLALTDHNGLYGAVRFYDYAQEIGIKPIIGAEIDLEASSPNTQHPSPNAHLVLLAKNLNGYSNLCKIITRAQLSHEKGHVAAALNVIAQHKDDLFCLSGCPSGEIPSLLARGRFDEAENAARRYIDIFGRRSFLIEMQNNILPGTALLNSRLFDLAGKLGLRTVATNNVHYALKEDFKVQDLLVCVQTITTLDDDHLLRKKNSEYYLKTPKAMANLFRRYPKAVAATDWVARQCNLDLGLGAYRFPDFPVPEGETAYSYLCKLCFEALDRLYHPITPQATARLQHELGIIHDLGFAEYFLVVWDIVRHARSKGIRCSGRGSAADSLVAYCLGITIVDPIEHNLLFERFLNPERRGMPDIDIDFDAARRDEVIEYIYNRYGKDKVAMVCTVSTLKAKSAIRDLGKAIDFSQTDIDRLASALPHTGSRRIREAVEKLPELRDGNLPVHKLEALIEVCEKVDDFPRHLSVHLGGLVIGRTVLTDLVPLEWATKGVIVSQFDKDDIEKLGLVKMDILGLRNLSAIEDALAMIRLHHGIGLDIDNIPLDDEPTYELLRSTNTVGCFQVESPGMRGLLGRLQPEVFDDVIAQISLFRPGPMQADMINPFVARRHGEEEITYLHPSLEPVLKDTYGVILYQEQVLAASHALAGFTYGQADSLRRAMTTDRSQDEMERIKDTFIAGACRNGVDKKTAEEVFSRLRAFAAYGFCKAHAASFGKICYQTAYLKAHYPAEFLAGILCNEPMGFYPPNVIIEEARHLGIRILGVDINRSEKKFTVEYEAAGERLEVGGRRSEVRGRRSEVGSWRSEVGSQRVRSADWAVESGERRVESGESRVEGGESRVESREHGADSAVQSAPSPGGEGWGEGASSQQRHNTGGMNNLLPLPWPERAGVRGESQSTPSPQREGWGEGASPEEQAAGVRVGLEQVKGISKAEIESILTARGSRIANPAEPGPGLQIPDHHTLNSQPSTPFPQPSTLNSQLFVSFSDFCLRARCDRPTVENLINCGAFDSFGIQRGKLMWLLGELISRRRGSKLAGESPPQTAPGFPNPADPQPCLIDAFTSADLDDQIRSLPDVPEPSLHERVRTEYEVLGLSTLCHPMIFYREKLVKSRILRTSQIHDLPNNTIIRVAGVVVVCMRPPTKSGQIVVFITLEDEEGLADCVVFPKVYDKYGQIIFNNPALIIEGKLQKMGRRGISIVARNVKPLSSKYRTDDSPDIKPFKERLRIAGARSFVRSGGV